MSVRRLLMLGMVVGLSGGSLLATMPEEAVLPELGVGTITGYLGGLIGASVLPSVLTAGGFGGMEATVLGTVLGYTCGTALGASIGVALAGSLLGVEGNVGLCFLGGMGGAGLTLGVLTIVVEFQLSLWFLSPVGAALGATAGFNGDALGR